MRPRRHYGPRKRSRADMRRAAQALLRDARHLENITVDTLVASYGFDRAEAERALAVARERRRGNG